MILFSIVPQLLQGYNLINTGREKCDQLHFYRGIYFKWSLNEGEILYGNNNVWKIFFSAVATNNVITMYNFLYKKKSQHRNKLKQKLITVCLYILSS